MNTPIPGDAELAALELQSLSECRSQLETLPQSVAVAVLQQRSAQMIRAPNAGVVDWRSAAADWTAAAAGSAQAPLLAVGTAMALLAHRQEPLALAVCAAQAGRLAEGPAWAAGMLELCHALALLRCAGPTLQAQGSFCQEAAGRLQRLAAQEPLLAGFSQLVEAELSAKSERFMETIRLYDEACKPLILSPWQALQALAQEGAADYQRSAGNTFAARCLWEHAAACYTAWGAPTPAARLRTLVLHKRGKSSGPQSSTAAQESRQRSTHSDSGSSSVASYPHATTHTSSLQAAASSSHVSTHSSTQSSTHSSTHTTARTSSQMRDYGAAGLDLQAVIHATKTMAGEVSPERIVERVVETLRLVGGATRILVASQRGSGLQVDYDTAEGAQDLPHELFAFVVRSQETLVVEDMSAAHGVADPYLVKNKRGSLLCVPWRQTADRVGLVYLENHVTSRAFSKDRTVLVEFLASQLAIALGNAEVYRNLESTIEQRVSAAKEADEMLSSVRAAQREMQMAGGFAHEMRNAISGARFGLATLTPLRDNDPPGLQLVYRDLLQRCMQAAAASPPDMPALKETLTALRELYAAVGELFGIVGDGIRRGSQVAQTILSYGQLARHSPDAAPQPVLEIAQGVISELTSKAQEAGAGIVVQVPGELTVPMGKAHMQALLAQLLRNALDAVNHEDAEERQVTLAARQGADGEVTLSVEDTGMGIDPLIEPRIFDPFFSTKGTAGIGLGLNIARRIAQMYRCELVVGSQPGEKTTFTVRFARP